MDPLTRGFMVLAAAKAYILTEARLESWWEEQKEIHLLEGSDVCRDGREEPGAR